MQFADLHCHPSLFGFNRLRNSKVESTDAFHGYHEFSPKVSHYDKGMRAAHYPQCSFPQLIASRTRLVFASITPIEKGFFVGGPNASSFNAELLKILSGATVAKTGVAARRGAHSAAGEALKIFKNDGPARRLLQKAFMGLSTNRIKFIQSHNYSYWDEYLRELDYLRAKDGAVFSGAVGYGGLKDRFGTTEGAYHLIRDNDHLRDVFENSNDVAVVLTIEGSHTFTMAPDETRVSEEVIFQRIAALKAQQERMLFVTISHHFDNGICGHSHSLIDSADWVMDQSVRLSEDYTPLGLKVTRELLSIDEDLNDIDGPRILLDLKHLSARARKTYFNEIVKPYNAKNPKNKIPVIFSHSGYSSVGTLDEIIENEGIEDDNHFLNPYLAWGINHCDEDVREVYASDGLIGICFDKRIAGVHPRQTIHHDGWIRVMLNQVLGIVDVIYNDDRIKQSQKKKIWDCIMIGSDFDGVIDPVSRYRTALDFNTFADDLRNSLNAISHTREIEKLGVENLVEKICWSNGYDFAKRHL